ncbi:MAG TPA: hypothetical protein DCY55_08020 [Gammaproteobacteria bacterium]|jgi:hypothetical protein|nr:hypothetical protein [Gammaproteobacteria bacterium]
MPDLDLYIGPASVYLYSTKNKGELEWDETKLRPENSARVEHEHQTLSRGKTLSYIQKLETLRMTNYDSNKTKI